MSSREKKYKVVVHDDAAQMLYSHIRFLANVSIPAARKLENVLNKAIRSLESMPHRCPIFQTHRTRDAYRRLIIGRYQVIFSVNEASSVVNVRYIYDSRQDTDI
jgi:plasmid stabilization system protein ParE